VPAGACRKASKFNDNIRYGSMLYHMLFGWIPRPALGFLIYF
jgi:hypothetical protein